MEVHVNFDFETWHNTIGINKYIVSLIAIVQIHSNEGNPLNLHRCNKESINLSCFDLVFVVYGYRKIKKQTKFHHDIAF